MNTNVSYRPGQTADLDVQARAWIVKLNSGAATHADLTRLASWRAHSSEAEAAFQRARSLWLALSPALRADADARVLSFPARPISRRNLIAGSGFAIAACAAGAAYIGSRQMLDASSGAVVFQTARGERQQVRVGVSGVVALNTATKVRVWSDGQSDILELLQGEALVTSTQGAGRPLVAVVGPTRISARTAQFVLRRASDTVSISCLRGELTVTEGANTYAVPPLSAFHSGPSGASLVAMAVLPQDVAWHTGQLIYDNQPLGSVVGELNRYRAGRIVVRGKGLAERRVSGVVHIERIDSALVNFARSLDVKITHLPAGVVILG